MKNALDLAHGVHFDVPDGVYHARVLGLASKHALDQVRRSPAHYKTWADGAEEKDTAALAFGRAFDCALLEPERFALHYVVEPDFGDCRKKENKANRDAWRDANKGAVWLPLDEYEATIAMAAAVRGHSRAGRLLSGGRSQVTVRWRDEDTGLECKLRADYLVEGDARVVVDVKTAENASPLVFPKAVANYGYHRQAAFYRDGFAAVGRPVDHFVFVVVEKAPPYAVAVYMLDEEAMALGRIAVRDALDTLADCMRRNSWEAYPEEIQVLPLPAWAA